MNLIYSIFITVEEMDDCWSINVYWIKMVCIEIGILWQLKIKVHYEHAHYLIHPYCTIVTLIS